MKYKITQRGFGYYEFKDGNGAKCSLQESSAARDEGLIWFGMDEDFDGSPVGKFLQPDTYHPEGTYLGARMHLSQSQVHELLPLLTYFAEHGELPTSEEGE
jgi:hypothetical protein